MTLDDFDQLIQVAIDSLPDEFSRKLDNVDVVSAVWPTPEDLQAAEVQPGSTLLGLYRGIPQTKRGHYTSVLPDKIILFAGPLLAVTGGDMLKLRIQVRNTLLHEIGHHFGMSEDEIRKATDKHSVTQPKAV